MDASSVEHSDSDSAESWTLLENPPDGNDKLKFQKDNHEIIAADNTDRDDDTDGISIISDSDPESTTPCELSYYKCLSREEECPTEKPTSNCVPINTSHYNNNDEDSVSIQGGDDFLGDNNGKVRTYVHKRNRRLSTVLNVVMLGSIITAAGIAIGHMWGANISKDECSINTFSSTNKILSNLYKLQEENAYLRSKLKELTLLYNVQTQHRKTEKPIHKQRRCKKVFEGPLTSENVQQHTKCVDNVSHIEKTTLASHMTPSENENIISSNIVKLKNEPKENALDNKIYKKVENNEPFTEQPEINSSSTLQVDQEEKMLEDNNSEKQPISHTQSTIDQQDNNIEALYVTNLGQIEPMKPLDLNMAENTNRKVNYKTEFLSEPYVKNVPLVSEHHDNPVSINLDEGYLTKDDRYVERKLTNKKHDRHKSYRKQKRKNKYQQWEMKGGYLKDYDTVSENSSYEKVNKKKTRQNSEEKDYKDQYTAISDNILSEDNNIVNNTKEKNLTKESNKKIHKEKNLSWYENRAKLRMEARKRLERELFGESSSSWYFRRMQRREQCRTKRDNGTYRRFTKQNLNNFKTRH